VDRSEDWGFDALDCMFQLHATLKGRKNGVGGCQVLNCICLTLSCGDFGD